ncbi:hypothetical protein [Halorientalis sp.]|jgi:hypothetical protein|uniref:hypothetical protein n=1 Tax=Halorientalis sp. TaxID=1931229 RepID=UPI002612BE4D|nr:hypothetical protein [Halorientalis sp.]
MQSSTETRAGTTPALFTLLAVDVTVWPAPAVAQADSSAATSDVIAGRRLDNDDETKAVTNGFAADGAAGCGETFGVDVDREVSYELGLPAGPDENELVLDLALDLER